MAKTFVKISDGLSLRRIQVLIQQISVNKQHSIRVKLNQYQSQILRQFPDDRSGGSAVFMLSINVMAPLQ